MERDREKAIQIGKERGIQREIEREREGHRYRYRDRETDKLFEIKTDGICVLGA